MAVLEAKVDLLSAVGMAGDVRLDAQKKVFSPEMELQCLHMMKRRLTGLWMLSRNNRPWLDRNM